MRAYLSENPLSNQCNVGVVSLKTDSIKPNTDRIILSVITWASALDFKWRGVKN